MNIFVTHASPIKSAIALDDKRVVKMILESCQMLNTATITLNGKGMGYKPTHKNHPCTLWVTKSLGNFNWLIRHMRGLCREYTKRYYKVHKCEQYISYFQKVAVDLPFETLMLTTPINCATDFKEEQDVYKAYQKQLKKKWNEDKRPPTWYRGGRRVPTFVGNY